MLMIIECINELTSRNSGNIRKLLMNNGFFEFKDNTFIQILKFEIKDSKLERILDGF